MAAKGYTSQSLVESELGQSLTAEQATYLATLIEQLEHEIDEYTGRAWLTGDITDEVYWLDDDFRPGAVDLYLRHRPVSTVTTVKVRRSLGESEETLVADQDYEVRDFSRGWIRFACRLFYDRIRVTYVPSDSAALITPHGLLVQRAATITAADWIRSAVEAMASGADPSRIQSYQIGADLAVTYRPNGVTGRALPPAARDILDMLSEPAFA